MAPQNESTFPFGLELVGYIPLESEYTTRKKKTEKFKPMRYEKKSYN